MKNQLRSPIFGFRVLSCAFLVFAFSTTSMAASLGVFIPGIESAAKLGDSLKADEALKGIDVFVFSKYKDFKIAMKSKNFDFIITNSYYLNYTKDTYASNYQFNDNGKETFSYHVITLKDEWKEKNFNGATLTTVQTLERKDMNTFVSKVLNERKFKRVKNISKSEDLFPILAMNNSDLALATPKMVEDMQKAYPTKPIKIVDSIAVKNIVFAKRNNSTAEVPDALKLNQQSLARMRVTGVKRM